MTDSPNAIAAYDELIMTHARAPLHATLGRTPVWERIGENRVCGDAVRISAAVTRDRWEIACMATGCAICRASGSLLMELAAETPTAQLKGVIDAFCIAFKTESSFASLRMTIHTVILSAAKDLLHGLEALHALRRFAARSKCVLLPWETLADLLADQYREGHEQP